MLLLYNYPRIGKLLYNAKYKGVQNEKDKYNNTSLQR